MVDPATGLPVADENADATTGADAADAASAASSGDALADPCIDGIAATGEDVGDGEAGEADVDFDGLAATGEEADEGDAGEADVDPKDWTEEGLLNAWSVEAALGEEEAPAGPESIETQRKRQPQESEELEAKRQKVE